MRILVGIAGVCALVLTVAGCGAGGGSSTADQDRDQDTATQEEWPPTDGVVTREQFEERDLTWPLTVDEGELRCEDEAITITVDGTVYAVNGLAEARGAQPIDPVWADDTELAKEIEEAGGDGSFISKIPITDLISVGQELC